jgi:DNA gyrase/topoisomerase IV subunit B
VNNQAVFTLKGKPLNVWNLQRDVVHKNDESYNLMRALGIETTLLKAAVAARLPVRAFLVCHRMCRTLSRQ